MANRTLPVNSSVKHVWPPFRTSYRTISLLLLLFLCTFAQGQGPGDLRYSFDILENLPPNTEVGSIVTRPGKTYSFATPTQNFSIDATTGLITTKTELDREKAATVSLVIRGSLPVYLLEVTVNILDENDNTPAFPQPSITKHFAENNKIGTQKILHTALDADAGDFGRVSNYEIVSGNEEDKFGLVFEVSDSSTFFFLENKVLFDREQIDSYTLNISAHDGGSPPLYCYLTVNVVIDDINDNSPVFLPSTYSVNVNESTPAGTSILKVQATDTDIGPNAEISYNITNPNLFAIDEYTGVITTKDTLVCPKYKCAATILATDRGAQGLTGRAYLTVTIEDENDHSPAIVYRLFNNNNRDYIAVNESALPDTAIAFVTATDKDRGDNGRTNVTLISGNEEGHFKLSEITGIGSLLQVASALDREQISTYNLSFVALDYGDPPRESRSFMIIHVTDANDHSPDFEQDSYSTSLSELAPVGSFVMGVTARDADDGLNAKITYRILAGNDRGWFKVDRDTGLVTTQSLLDRENLTNPYIVLNISAQDGGIPSFTAYTSVSIFISDENDQSPKFSQDTYRVSLSEDDPMNTPVVTLLATDDDQGLNGTVSYAFTSDVEANYPGKFRLNQADGFLQALVTLDREDIPSYVIKVIASDQGSPRLSSTAIVILDITDLNDNYPVFYPANYYESVLENQPSDTSVVQVTATDMDADENARLSYSITSGAEGKFSIDVSTGLITTTQTLLRRQKAKYTLEVSASDHGSSPLISQSNAVVEITIVQDTQNMPPVFNSSSGYTFLVVEDGDDSVVIKNRWVGAVNAQYQDNSAVSYTITGGDPHRRFTISSSGVIRTAKKIDREVTGFYTLTVVASGGIVPGQAIVNVSVTDLNDNAPSFPVPGSSVTVYVVENSPIGHEVYLASAVDADDGLNAMLTYTLISDALGTFGIDPTTGVIYLTKLVTLGSSYSLSVGVTDSGSNQKSALLDVQVRVTDVNDHTPTFTENGYEFSIIESRDVNYQFATLTASDLDTGVNGKVTYSITAGNVGSYFGIFPDGVLYIAKALDREMREQYLLTVKAVDHGVEPRSALVNITIHVIDANDNRPTFSNETYNFNLKENAPSGTSVGSVSATDLDLGRNSELSFAISDNADLFEIDQLSGVIQSLRSFDRETVMGDVVQLEVTVTDNGLERLNATALVKVHITDINDNPPVFSQPFYSATINEKAFTGTLVVRVNTTDKDIGRNKFVIFTLIEGNDDGKFAIDRSSGQLSLVSKLDRELKNFYTLTVLATDTAETNTLNATAEIRIRVLDFNDNPPEFNCTAFPCSVDVEESTSPGSLVGTVFATDNDYGNNAAISYAITDGNKADTFQINSDSGQIFLSGMLNFDNINQYGLDIRAVDAGEPLLAAYVRFTISVVDHNDKPVFSDSTGLIDMVENTGQNEYITTVTAIDPDFGDNGRLSYSIKMQKPSGSSFSIEESTGKIYTTENIDRETSSFYDLTVVAVDGGKIPMSAEMTITINVKDENDNAPTFISTDAAIVSAGALSGSLVTKVQAVDPDDGINATVTYSVVDDLFHISQNTGELVLKKSMSSTSMTHVVQVTATDGGSSPRSATMSLTVIVSTVTSNNQLLFGSSSYTGVVDENQPVGTPITTLTATNPSNSQANIEYYVTAVAVNGGDQLQRFFQINKQSGLLSTAQVLDREQSGSINTFSVTVYAIDKTATTPQSRSTQVLVTLNDKNDSPPVFTPDSYYVSIQENTGSGQSVTTVTATDADKNPQIRFAIVDGSNGRFEIDLTSGLISTTEDLDREVNPQYELTVSASDGLHTSFAPVQVDVLDLNDNAPQFSKDVYAFSVREDTAQGTIIGYISAYDNDNGANGTITYSNASEWGMDVFSLGTSRGVGVFKLIGLLDRERSEHYVITAVAVDRGNPSLSSEVEVYINILDNNDNAPVFDPASYSTNSLSENATIGTSVITVHATDQDAGENSDIAYSIVSGDLDGQFRIDEISGTIYTAKRLDREQQAVYSIGVLATDKASDPSERLSSSTTVNVVLKDVNDEFPVFTSPDVVWVMENLPVTTTVMTVHAEDKDTSSNGYVQYSLASVPGNAFSLNPTHGFLVVNGPLDRESKDTYQLTVTATDLGDSPKSTQQNLLVKIRDENDNTPVISPKQYSASVPENAAIGKSLLTVAATDGDDGLNGVVRFFIISGDDNQDFAIEQKTGILRVLKKLNYERKKSYSLTIQAEDSGADVRYDTATATISVTDINDNAPIFLHSPYHTYVQENMAQLPVHVMRVSAYDSDSGSNKVATYVIREGDEGIFEIDSTSGDVTATRTLDREERSQYQLIVTASDGGNPRLTGTGTINVHVLDVNDHTPVFQQMSYVGLVPENSLVGTHVLNVRATDGDTGVNAQIRYHLQESAGGRFTVNAATGEIVTTNIGLDREQENQYSLVVVASDGATKPRQALANVVVQIQDVNDNQPVFEKTAYDVFIPDNTNSGEFIVGVTALDKDIGLNGKITYSLLTFANSFRIDQSTGVITAAQTLAASIRSEYVLRVRASDKGQNPEFDETTVRVRFITGAMRNQYPAFTSGTDEFTIQEGQTTNQLTRLTANSPIGRPISYFVSGGNLGSSFDITSQGVLRLVKPLDYEEATSIDLWIEARDSGTPSLSSFMRLQINVTDLNDNAPIFTELCYVASIPEDAVYPQLVSTVTANDADSNANGLVQYSIVSGNTNNDFSIDASTGEVKVADLKSLDRESIASYSLIIKALDQGFPAKSGQTKLDITISDVNDHQPMFTGLLDAAIPEDASIGSFVIQVITTDKDIGINAKPSYELVDSSGTFVINTDTGVVTVNQHLDRETKEQYQLSVKCTDGRYSIRTTLTIYILDVNDEPPVFNLSTFSFNFKENTATSQHVETFVGDVLALDRDDTKSPNSKVTYTLKYPSEEFSLRTNNGRGQIFTKKVVRYIPPTGGVPSPDNRYELIILARDMGVPTQSAETTAVINVVDANDNPPVFEKTNYFSPIPENSNIGTSIIQVSASDAIDFGLNAEVEYSLASGGNGTALFDVDQATGWVRVKATLGPGRRNGDYIILVNALDKGQPRAWCSDSCTQPVATVKLTVTGINNAAPAFTESNYQVTIPEDKSVGSVLKTLTARDLDSGLNGRVSYFLTGGDPTNLFSIDESGGYVTVRKPLDYDVQPVHNLVITAKDRGLLSRSATTTLRVILTDVNDNVPSFGQDEYDVVLAENSPSGTSVLRVQAVDADSAIFAEIQYSIVGDNSAFTIDQSGVIYSQGALNYETQQFYSINVIATNPKDPRNGMTTVNVHLSGVNEFYPKFVKKSYTFNISESEMLWSSVGQVVALDDDKGTDGNVLYFLVGDSNDMGFTVGKHNGSILVTRQLDRESSSSISLKILAKNEGPLKGNDTDTCMVTISLKDANDPPVFSKPVYQQNVNERTQSGATVIKVTATDDDLSAANRQFKYRLGSGNVGNAFSINEDTGLVTVAGSLDRETLAQYDIVLLAVDSGSPPQTGSAELLVILEDYNDNGPYFTPSIPKGYILENQGTFASVMNLRPYTNDPDESYTTNPFRYQLLSDQSLFDLDESTGLLRARVSLDREQTPDYTLQVRVTDGGIPVQTSTLSVEVIVQDLNDNRPSTRTVSILVNTYGSIFPGGKIGDVKPLDSDLTGDYSCTISQGASGLFTMSASCMLNSLPRDDVDGSYTLQISSNDGEHSPDVVSTTTVNFRSFDNATLKNSISIRLNNVTAQHFMESNYVKFQQTLKGLIGDGQVILFGVQAAGTNLDVFLAAKQPSGAYISANGLQATLANSISVIESGASVKIAGVEDACMSSPCMHGGICDAYLEVANTYVVANSPRSSHEFASPSIKKLFRCTCPDGYIGARCQNATAACNVSPCKNGGLCVALGSDLFRCDCPTNYKGRTCEVDVNECEKNPCRNGGTCSNTPGSFTCQCAPGYEGATCAPISSPCSANPCNNGVCKESGEGFTCDCEFGYYGDRCQDSSRGFNEGSYMEYGSLQSSANVISLEFATVMQRAMLLYNPGGNSSGHFLAVELVDGKPKLSFQLGSGSSLVEIVIQKNVADGQWHKIRAVRNGKVGTLLVSDCPNGPSSCSDCAVSDNSCVKSFTSTGSTSNLEVSAFPLSIGGVRSFNTILNRPGQVVSHDFVGCMANIVVDNQQLLRQSAAVSSGVTDTCPRLKTSSCSANTCANGGQCYDEWSYQRCECMDGFQSEGCKTASQPFTFGPNARVDYVPRKGYARDKQLAAITSNRKRRAVATEDHTIDIEFRTLKDSGLLFISEGPSSGRTILQVTNHVVKYTSRLNGAETEITSTVNVSDSKVHALTLAIKGNQITMTIDGIAQSKTGEVHNFLGLEITGISLGSTNKEVTIGGTTLIGFEGCVMTFKMDGKEQPYSGSTERFTVVPSAGDNSGTNPSCVATLCASIGCSSDCKESAGSVQCLVAEDGGLSIGVIIVIAFFSVVIVGAIIFFIVFRLRKQRSKNKNGPQAARPKQQNGVQFNLNKSQTESTRTLHDSGYTEHDMGMDLPDDAIIASHIAGEMNHRKYNEREVKIAHQRPDIIEPGARQLSSITPVHMGDGTVIIDDDFDGIMPDQGFEHYDLDNASSIAPSDIDVIQHYRGYRDRKNFSKPPRTHKHAHIHSPVNGPGRPPLQGRDNPLMRQSPSIVNNPVIRQSPLPVNSRQTPLSVRQSPLTVNNLSRQSPHGAIMTRQSPYMLANMRNTPLSMQHVRSPSNLSDSDNSVVGIPDPRLHNMSPHMANGHGPGSRPSSRPLQPMEPMGLTLNDVRLNSRQRASPVSTLDAVSSSSDGEPMAPAIPRPDALLEAPESSSDESSNDSFTCSEFEYENEKVRNDFDPNSMIFTKVPEEEVEDDESLPPIQDTQKMFTWDNFSAFGSTVIPTSEDGSSISKRSRNGTFNWDYLLNWGPSFEKLVGVFGDIAQLPDSDSLETVPPVGDREEYV